MIHPKNFLPIWLKKPDEEPLKTADAFNLFWNRLESFILKPLEEIDPKICTQISLGYHAWENNVVRIVGESLESFRKRVDEAMSILDQAGSKKGLKAILSLYGLQIDKTNYGGLDWDMVLISVDTQAIDAKVMTPLLEEWGRLCRRYVFSHTSRYRAHFHIAVASQAEHQFKINLNSYVFTHTSQANVRFHTATASQVEHQFKVTL